MRQMQTPEVCRPGQQAVRACNDHGRKASDSCENPSKITTPPIHRNSTEKIPATRFHETDTEVAHMTAARTTMYLCPMCRSYHIYSYHRGGISQLHGRTLDREAYLLRRRTRLRRKEFSASFVWTSSGTRELLQDSSRKPPRRVRWSALRVGPMRLAVCLRMKQSYVRGCEATVTCCAAG